MESLKIPSVLLKVVMVSYEYQCKKNLYFLNDKYDINSLEIY